MCNYCRYRNGIAQQNLYSNLNLQTGGYPSWDSISDEEWRNVLSNYLMLRTELTELVVRGFQAHGIELGFEAKMADATLEFEHLELGVGQHGGKEMGGLRGQGFGGRLAHRGVLFERLVVFFHTKSLMRFSTVSGKSWSVGPGPGRCRC